MNPDSPHNWRLVCSNCAAEWPPTDKINLVEGHFQREHPEAGNPAFSLVWRGVGPEPRKSRYKRHGVKGGM